MVGILGIAIRKALSIAQTDLSSSAQEAQSPREQSRPILRLHGFGATSHGLIPLARHLERNTRRPVIRIGLSPGISDLRTSAREACAALKELASAPDFEYVDLVGHSMGGLIAVYMLKGLDRGRHIRRVITLGTPHRGTPAAMAGVLPPPPDPRSSPFTPTATPWCPSGVHVCRAVPASTTPRSATPTTSPCSIPPPPSSW